MGAFNLFEEARYSTYGIGLYIKECAYLPSIILYCFIDQELLVVWYNHIVPAIVNIMLDEEISIYCIRSFVVNIFTFTYNFP